MAPYLNRPGPSSSKWWIREFEGGKKCPLGRTRARSGVGKGGLGLELVRGLVANELAGSFTFQPLPGGGHAARIQFPINLEEAEHANL